MNETQIDKILNYMKQYVENIYEHDSEPMLNWKDLEILLDYITNLQEENEKLNKELDKTRLSELHKEYVINEFENTIKKEIDRTEELIVEDGKTSTFSVIREMLNEERTNWLYILKHLKDSDNNDYNEK